jgi:acyl-coenzyme A thioesterase PaaI-like protein
LAKEQAQPVVIVEGGAEFAAADAVARRAVVAQHAEGDATDQGQIFGAVNFFV